MNITMTASALEAIRKLLTADVNYQAIYVYLAGIGCGGGGKASFSLMPVDRPASEHRTTVEGIPFEYDRLILFHTDSLHIDYPYADAGKDIQPEYFLIQPAGQKEESNT